MSFGNWNPHDFRYSFSGSDCKAYAYYPGVENLKKFMENRIGEFDTYIDNLKNDPGLKKAEELEKKADEQFDKAIEHAEKAKEANDRAVEAADILESGIDADAEQAAANQKGFGEMLEQEKEYFLHCNAQAAAITAGTDPEAYEGQVTNDAGLALANSYGTGSATLNDGASHTQQSYTNNSSDLDEVWNPNKRNEDDTTGAWVPAQTSWEKANPPGNELDIDIPSKEEMNGMANTNQALSAGGLTRDVNNDAGVIDMASATEAQKTEAIDYWEAEQAAAGVRGVKAETAAGKAEAEAKQLGTATEQAEGLLKENAEEQKRQAKLGQSAVKKSSQLRTRREERYAAQAQRILDEIDRAEGARKTMQSMKQQYQNQDWVHLDSIQTISISINEAKAPARRLGHRDITGMSRSARTIAGTMILTVVDNHPLAKLMVLDPQQIVKGFKGSSGGTGVAQFKWFKDQNLGRGGGGSDPLGVGRTYIRTATDLAPFNIFLEYASEYPGPHLRVDSRIVQGRARQTNQLASRINEINTMLNNWGFQNANSKPVPRDGEPKKAFEKRLKSWQGAEKAATARAAMYNARTGEAGGGVDAATTEINKLGMNSEDLLARDQWQKDQIKGYGDSKFEAIKALIKERDGLQKDLDTIQNEQANKLKGFNTSDNSLSTAVVNPVRLQLEGVEFLHEGIVTSTHDMVTEITYQFIARDYYELYAANEDPMSNFPDIQDVLAEFAYASDVSLGFDAAGNEISQSQFHKALVNPLTGVVQTTMSVAPDDDNYQMTATAGPSGELMFPEPDGVDMAIEEARNKATMGPPGASGGHMSFMESQGMNEDGTPLGWEASTDIDGDTI